MQPRAAGLAQYKVDFWFKVPFSCSSEMAKQLNRPGWLSK
ncbi:hypothetical protein IMPR6_160061 [Imperialibacter sp. EC-SDR9]|nr:hypothetical protein IMPERIA89_10382 [Imperialibacter sp. 89]VVT06921.1 hypothetical protein IMPR6_160061 [Imperialibacter sp. EC-SDR9]